MRGVRLKNQKQPSKMIWSFLIRTGLVAKLVKFIFFSSQISLQRMIELPFLRETVNRKTAHCFQEAIQSTQTTRDGRFLSTSVTMRDCPSTIREARIQQLGN